MFKRSRIRIKPSHCRGCILALTVVVVSTTFAAAPAQGPQGSDLPARSDHRGIDPCEQAVKPEGLALGLQAQCQPLGGGGVAKGDFNGDGIGDLAVGVPFEDLVGGADAGAVNVIYGSTDGLTDVGNQFLRQGGGDVPGTAETGDHFGWSLASGNFNGDGYSDLAVGVPDEDFNTLTNVGQVFVFHGSETGLTFAQAWDHRDLPAQLFGLENGWVEPRSGDQFGYSLVWADFNGDETGDLAVGVPGAEIGKPELFGVGLIADAGAVVTLFGDDDGLSAFGAQVIAQGFVAPLNTAIIPRFGGVAIEGDGFGRTLTAGDYDGDSFDDVAIGVPANDGPTDSGEVHVISGSAAGLNRLRNLRLGQGNSAEEFDFFGSALATGDFNGDGRDDLAVGAPLEDLVSNTAVNAGSVHTFLGAANGFTLGQVVSQGIAAETGDRFGWALAAGDFNGDGREDLAVGSPGENLDSTADVGIVQIFSGTASGITQNATQVWHQAVSGIVGTAEAGDQFGFALSAWNFGKTTQADLAVGIPFEDVFNIAGDTIVDAGAVQVIYGSASGLVTTGNQQWTQNNLSGSVSETGDQFGRAVY